MVRCVDTFGQIASNKLCSALPKTVVVLGFKKKKKKKKPNNTFFFPYKTLNEKLYNKYESKFTQIILYPLIFLPN